jgi:uncharacterized protein YkwD
MQAIINKLNDRAKVLHAFRNHARSTSILASKALAVFVITLLFAQPAATFAAQPPPAAPQLPDSPSARSTRESAAIPAPLNLTSVLAPMGQPAVQGGFLQTYQRYGLRLMGYPLTPELIEGGTTVQYFERVKMEWHPEFNAQGTPVLFTRLGAEISAGSPFGRVKPVAATNSRSYFDATGHSLGEPFRSFWRNNGGISLFGYPISEPVHQDGMLVQWFERARMESHPELASKGQPVQLTLLGRIALSREHKPASAPAPPPAPPQVPGGSGMENNLLAGINTQRAAAGAPPVSVNPDLATFARWRSADMASHNYFAHTTSDGKGSLQALREHSITYSMAGEILAKNNYPESESANVAISTFLDSLAHRQIMLDSRYTQVGVGYATGSDGTHYFTAVFIRK